MKNEWIPCSERLPEHNDFVLTYRPSLVMKMFVDRYAEYYGDERWQYGHDSVVAWMPLPEPYVEEQG